MDNTGAIVNNIISTVEKQVDEELDKLDSKTIEDLRNERLRELKRDAQLRCEWVSAGHGEYTELEEREFFQACKQSKEMVIHFYTRGSMRCSIFDHHLKKLAPKHMEARFIKINAEKAPFLAERLSVRIIPTLLIAINNKIVTRLLGFEDLGNCDDFTTETLEWKLGTLGVIKYEGNLSQPALTGGKKSKINVKPKRSIREEQSSSDSDY